MSAPINDGGPAFPGIIPPPVSGFTLNVARGMSLRAYIATDILSTTLSFSGTHSALAEKETTPNYLAASAVAWADVLITELSK